MRESGLNMPRPEGFKLRWKSALALSRNCVRKPAPVLWIVKRRLRRPPGTSRKRLTFYAKKELQQLQKKPTRVAADGAVGAYVHPGGKIGVLLEINCETDFVARNAEFQALLKDVAMQIAAANPRFVRRDEVSSLSLTGRKRFIASRLWSPASPKRSSIKSSRVRWNGFIPRFACSSSHSSKTRIVKYQILSMTRSHVWARIFRCAVLRATILVKGLRRGT